MIGPVKTFSDNSPWVVYLDESGDQGRPSIESLMYSDFDPKKQWKKFVGATRFFTVGVIAVQASFLSTVEKEYGERLRKKKEGNERKWSVCSDQSRNDFFEITADLLRRFPDKFRISAVTLDKSQTNIEAIHRDSLLSPEQKNQVKKEKIDLYNELARQAIARSLCTVYKSPGGKTAVSFPTDITILCDQRPVSKKAYDELRSQTIFEIQKYADNNTIPIQCHLEPVNSKEHILIQMSDFVAGFIRQNYEQNIRPKMWNEIHANIRERLLLPSDIPAHETRHHWSGVKF